MFFLGIKIVTTSIKMTKIQCWVHKHDLLSSFEVLAAKGHLLDWHDISTPLFLDDCTMTMSERFFACVVLVNVDLLSHLPSQIFVEKSSFIFIVYVKYEKFPCGLIMNYLIVGDCNKMIKPNPMEKNLLMDFNQNFWLVNHAQEGEK